MRPRLRYLVSAFVLFAGCTANSLPPETDPAKGREVLKQVLDSWIGGGTAENLRNGNPPVVAYDPDWEAGYKLTKYELDPADRRVGVDLLVTVTLTLSKAGDPMRTKTVNFSIAIGSQTVVLRQT